MLADNPEISIVICSFNRAKYIGEAMLSLYNQTLEATRYEVIIVDNASTDNTADICREFIAAHPETQFTYLLEPRQGASFARNTGAAIAKAPLLCFMDDDAIAEIDFLKNIIQFFKEVPEAGGLGGRIIPRYIPAEPKWMSHFVSSLVGHFHYSEERTPFRKGKYPLESNMIVKTADFHRIGGFNTKLPGVSGTLRIGGEGKDFFFRLMELGNVIYYDPTIRVEHVVETAKLTPEYMYRVASGIGRGERVRMLEKGLFAYLFKILEYLFKLGASFLLAIGYLLQGHSSKCWPVIQFRIDALKGLLNH
ncbi:MAG: glycosyltransferase family 2 protein [Chitinophagia bacterium]|nr:glycosyltransferase family 2 protein [Chitinophagia bacterium]